MKPLNVLVLLALLLMPLLSFACQSPVGTWLATDASGTMKLVFHDDGTGAFFPDIDGNERETTLWAFISPMQRPSTEPADYAVETNVLEVQFEPPAGSVEYLLCTGNRLIGQLFLYGEFHTYVYSRQP